MSSGDSVDQIRRDAAKYAGDLGCYDSLVQGVFYSATESELRQAAHRAFGPGSEKLRDFINARLDA